MTEPLIVVLLLLAIPSILWAVPRTRRRTGNWIVAFKSVPVGCAVVIAVPVLLAAVLKRLPEPWILPLLRYCPRNALLLLTAALGLAAGIAVIVRVSRLIYRHNHAEGKRSWLPHAGLFVFLGIATAVLSIAYSVVRYEMEMRSGKRGSGAWRAFELPTGNGVQLAFEERSIHPFLAEYDYRLRFRKNGKLQYHRLRTNCGGRTRFNLYRLKDGRLLFRNKDGEYLVDADRILVWLLLRQDGKTYLAPYPNEEFNSWGWCMENGKMIFRYGKKSVEAQPLTDELENRSYYGGISDRFYSASEQPENAGR